MMYWFKYSDNSIKFKEFTTAKEAGWYAHTDGDQCKNWGICSTKSVDFINIMKEIANGKD